MGAVVRPYRSEDLEGLYRVCFLTGDAGNDATGQFADESLLGHVYAGPYGIFEPELAFVLDDDGEVVGYVLGALDTAAFDARLEAEWWPDLRARYPEGSGSTAPGHRDNEIIAAIHHRIHMPPAITDGHPSHLHIDIVAGAQGHGHGRQLMEALLDALRARSSPGVHFGVAWTNERAHGFYRHLGFVELYSVPDLVVIYGLRF